MNQVAITAAGRYATEAQGRDDGVAPVGPLRTSDLAPVGSVHVVGMPVDCRPGDPAPETGHYTELNVSGQQTGILIYAKKGDLLLRAPIGFTWRLVKTTADRLDF